MHISEDVIPNREARQRLERASRGWRGVTALDLPEVELHPPKTVLQPLPPSFISQSPHSICTNPHVRPPSFSLHTAHPVPRSAMITPYPSTILPSSTYLSDPLNAYAYLGMPKPFVHLIGPPLDLALDSRITGSEARFARSGCRPNAVLRPMICNQLERRKKKPSSDEESGMSFGVFALRDIKANEEVVLGWEWDDGHAIHHLPTLIESPGLYSCVLLISSCSQRCTNRFRTQASPPRTFAESNVMYASHPQFYLHNMCLWFEIKRLCPTTGGGIRRLRAATNSAEHSH